jgi:hypothetical protein
MSNEYDNNPKAGDPGTETATAEGIFTDRPAMKRNKSADPEADASGEKYLADEVKSG